MERVLKLVLLLAGAVGMAGCQLELVGAGDEPVQAEGAPAAPQDQRVLVIENDSELPAGYPHRPYELRLHAHGAVSAIHWKVEKGALPPGMKLEDNGLLHGEPERPGEFQFTVSEIGRASCRERV